MTTPDNEFADIQGLLWSGYGPLKEACFLLLRVTDAAAARAWLRVTAESVTSIEQLRQARVGRALHIALTAGGMRALGVAEGVIDGFSAEFIAGLAGDEGRSRRLGDLGTSAPSLWRWGGPQEPHILLMMYTAENLDAWRAQIEAALGNGLAVLDRLSTADMGGEEPFGFMDGVSQPRIDWSAEREPDTTADLDYGNLLTAGEFLLGYRNEYGLYTDRPLLDPEQPGATALPIAEDNPARRDLGRNGSYLVMRELTQDVRGFWRFIMAQSADSDAGIALAQAFVGRQMSGDGLVPARAKPIRGVGPRELDIARNQFTYDEDPAGLRCPFGAHVRRANPRTGDMPGGRQGLVARLLRMLGLGRQDLSQDLIAASRFHRIIRRGRPYGPPLHPSAEPKEMIKLATAAGGVTDTAKRGLNFLCFNANIERQFEFIQQTWLDSPSFHGLSGEQDPLVGGDSKSCTGFLIPSRDGPVRLKPLRRFVTTLGGGYFFLPSKRLLEFLGGDD
jgi:deferrochelatase/peroxidase EfeB